MDRGDHFTQKTRDETEDPHRHQQNHQVEKRPEPLPQHEAVVECDETGQHASGHEQEPRQSEGDHRLAGKAQLEPDGEQVQDTADDPALARVLGLAGAPGVQLDVDFGCGEALAVGEHDEEPVPVVAEAHGAQDVGAEGLHRVQVAHGHVEDAAAEGVVDRRDRALVVPSHLAPGDDVPPLLEPVQEAGDLGGQVLQVGVEEDQVAPLRRGGRRQQRLGLALVDAVAEHPQAVPPSAFRLGQRGRSVGGPVVDQDHLAGQAELVEGGA